MGRTLDAISLDQRDAAMRKLGVKDEIIHAEHRRMAQVYAAIRSGKPPPKDTPAETVASLAPMVPYLASHFRHDPAYTAKKVAAAVLIAHGERDGQIPVGDAKLLRDLYKRAGHRKVTMKLYPGLNHLFTPVKKDTVEDLSDPELAIDMAFVGDVVTFLRATL
jgi:alpha-beta hydrolase superfamily lysophospholipase